MKIPTVSVGIPTYNGEQRISRALNSIFQQNYAHVEIVISDNCSTDDTEAVCRSYAEADPRIKYYRQPENKGLAFNFEFVMLAATGDYFIWLSDDDEMLPNILQKYVDFMEANPDYSLVCGEIDYWSGDILTDKEKNLNFELGSGMARSIGYYAKVKEGAMIYGLMRQKQARRIEFKSILGPDWHFVAALAYMGKIKQLTFTGYNKYPGGISRNFRHYARIVREAPIWGFLPYTKMAIDAAKEIIYLSPVFKKSSFPTRLLGGISASVALWSHYNLWIVPKMILGRGLRVLGIKTPKQRRLAKLQAEN